MKILYLDDLRTPSKVYSKDDVRVARNFEEALNLVRTDKFDMWSLDHDLGEEKTGYDFVKTVAYEYPERWCDNIHVHSANPIGKENIDKFVLNFNEHRVENMSTQTKITITRPDYINTYRNYLQSICLDYICVAVGLSLFIFSYSSLTSFEEVRDLVFWEIVLLYLMSRFDYKGELRECSRTFDAKDYRIIKRFGEDVAASIQCVIYLSFLAFYPESVDWFPGSIYFGLIVIFLFWNIRESFKLRKDEVFTKMFAKTPDSK